MRRGGLYLCEEVVCTSVWKWFVPMCRRGLCLGGWFVPVFKKWFVPVWRWFVPMCRGGSYLCVTITIYFINPSGKLKLSFDRTTKNMSQ